VQGGSLVLAGTKKAAREGGFLRASVRIMPYGNSISGGARLVGRLGSGPFMVMSMLGRPARVVALVPVDAGHM